MNTVKDFIKVLLWACIEDYAGLWELLWEVNSKFPELTDAEKKCMSLEALQLLIEKDFIRLYRCKEPYGKLSELEASVALVALTKEKNWVAPELADVSIRAGATQKGEALYKSGKFGKIGTRR